MITLELVTLNGTKFKADVYEVQVPTPQGIIGVFENHSPLVSSVSTGMLSIRHQENHPDDMLELIAVTGGVLELSHKHARILVDEADREDEINEAEAQGALERAKELRDNAKDQVSLDKAQAMLDRQTVRLKVADLRRHRRPRSKS